MHTYTTTNDKVQHYLTYSDKKASKHRKLERMRLIAKSLEAVGTYLDELFKRKSIRVLDEIAYLTTICGVIKIGAEKLAELAQTSVRTVYSAVKTIKQYKELGFVVGYLKNSHKYVFVDLKASNAYELLQDIFGLTAIEIAECFADPPRAEEPRGTRDTRKISDSNNITKNKTLKDLKTSTKDRTSSVPTYRSFYVKLKELFKARRGSLNDFKQFVGVIYGKMKKLRADGSLQLSNDQLEQIMYQSLDALLHKKGVKNEQAMLNAIINNKINDLTMPATTPTVTVAAAKTRTEVLPDWFVPLEKRTDMSKPVNTVETDEDLDEARARVLKKLGLA